MRRVSLAATIGTLSALITAGLPAAAAAQRVTVDMKIASLRPLWIRRNADDTTLLRPNLLLVRDGRIFLTDPAGPAVIALDAATGKTLWRYARRGSGPGEPGIWPFRSGMRAGSASSITVTAGSTCFPSMESCWRSPECPSAHS